MIKRLVFNKSDFVRNTFTLITGTALAQAIPILLTPLLSRLYTPSDWGNFAFFMSVVSGLVVFASMRYELAIFLPKDNEDALHLVKLCVLICVLLSTCVLAVSLIIKFFFSSVFISKPFFFRWLYLVPLLLLITGLFQIFANYLNRSKNYKTIAGLRVTNSLTTVVVNVAEGFARISTLGLLMGTFAGQLVTTSAAAFRWLKNVPSTFSVRPDWRKIKEQATKYKEFPKINSLQALVDMLQVNGPIYLITYFFPGEILGSYYFAMRILQAPLSLIAAAIAQVFYQRVSEDYNNNIPLRGITKGTLKKAVLLALPIFIILTFFAKRIFIIVFDQKWAVAGEFVQILSPWLFFDFLRMCISQLPLVVGKQRQLFLMSVSGNIILFASLVYAGIVTHDIKTGFYMMSTLLSVQAIAVLCWLYRISNLNTYNDAISDRA